MTFFRLVVIVSIPALFAQQPPAFDVAAIKPADPSSKRFGMGFSANGRTMTVDGLNLEQMIRMAYGVTPDRMSVSPLLTNAGWIHSDPYDINAKSEAATPAGKDEQNRMFQQLLADRFGVKVHLEQKEVLVYSLVVGKNGPKLSPGGPVSPYISRPAPGKFVGTNASMGSLAGALGGQLGRPSVDDTGLQGGFDFTLTWTPDNPDTAGDTTGPSLFSALQDQLGLKLETKKLMMDAIVVDQARKPSEN